MDKMANKLVIGIDLAGSEENRSGFAIIKEEFGEKDTKSRTIFSDEEILQEIGRLRPKIVAIDAPITKVKKDRVADKEMKKYGRLSLAIPGMQILAQRADKLAAKIKKQNIVVLEVNSEATAQIMGLEKNALSKSTHQADAILAAMTGFLHLEEKTKDVGDKDGFVIIPRPSRKKPVAEK